MLVLHNSLSGKKEPFTPLKPGEVSFYVCGVTVYDYSHIGHARVYVNFDCMRRFLEDRGFTVKFIQNFTDIDDKIIARSQESGTPYLALTQTFIEAYLEDMGKLFVKPATAYPKATEHIAFMQEMIATLMAQGAAYEVDGDVIFRVSSFPSYGKLSKKVLEDLQSGIRVERSDKKENPLDFVLWKAAKPGEPSWDSPWGLGRPGWHIECSAMAIQHLGPTIDIHGGGEDLVFPHHENEICQSESFTHQPFANYWLHNGFVTIKNEKMSKSKGNFFTIRDILKEFDGEVIRFFLLKVHYRSPLHFSFEGLQEAKQALQKLRHTMATMPLTQPQAEVDAFALIEKRFYEAIEDDFNFTQAIGILFDLNRLIHKTGSGTAVLLKLGQLLGLLNPEPSSEEPVFSEVVWALVAQRQEAKKNKNYALADQLRAELADVHQVILEDTAAGPKLKAGPHVH